MNVPLWWLEMNALARERRLAAERYERTQDYGDWCLWVEAAHQFVEFSRDGMRRSYNLAV